MSKEEYKGLVDHCKTDKQRQIVKLLNDGKSQSQVCKELGIAKGTIHDHLSRIRKQAAYKGISPKHDLTHPVADGFILKGYTHQRDGDGNITNEWLKAWADQDQFEEMIRAAVDEMKQDIKPLAKIPKPKQIATDSDQLNLYIATDWHIGMLSWHEESGDDWDVKIAENTLKQAIDYLIETSPKSKEGFFCQLGDGLHSDGLLPVTPTSHNVLDQDGRYPKVVRAAIRIFRHAIERMANKYEKLHVLMAQGNHDLAGSVWLQEMFHTLYENSPHINVIRSPLPYYAHVHGDCLLAFHHGHKRKVKDLPETVNANFRHLLSQTKKTFIHTGHLHSGFLE